MVGLVLLSHSLKLVEGIRDIVDEMAKGIPLYLAGGNSEGGLGSSYELIKEVFQKAYSPEGVIVLYDIGSSFMTAEFVLDELDDNIRSSIKIIKAPLVEGAIVAAVEISSGASFVDLCELLREMEMVK